MWKIIADAGEFKKEFEAAQKSNASLSGGAITAPVTEDKEEEEEKEEEEAEKKEEVEKKEEEAKWTTLISFHAGPEIPLHYILTPLPHVSLYNFFFLAVITVWIVVSIFRWNV